MIPIMIDLLNVPDANSEPRLQDFAHNTAARICVYVCVCADLCEIYKTVLFWNSIAKIYIFAIYSTHRTVAHE